MQEHENLLSIRLDGKAVGPGRISVSHLLRLLSQLNKVLIRSGQVLKGEADSLRKGPKEKQLKDIVALDLVKLTHGSPAVVLGLERKCPLQYSLPGMDHGLEIIEKAIAGLHQVQQDDNTLPPGYDTGVLMAWRDMGVLLEQGVSEIRFTLNHRPQRLETRFTPDGYRRLQQRIKGPQINIRTIEGRLLMADFKEHGTRCRVHPSVGDPVLCLFNEEQKEEVLENILYYVKVIGEAKEDPVTGKITSIKLHDIERLEDREDEGVDLLPKGSPLPMAFWQSPSIEELAAAQGVQPISNFENILGDFWPEDESVEEFIACVDHWRDDDSTQEKRK
ncbi:MAG: hypothetical protein DRH50_04645 [Deltaproteobacteria bacterium]|nr:MAG: hypothetical protein DRH50_04645 [Deltaproteobacteria bacterium]